MLSLLCLFVVLVVSYLRLDDDVFVLIAPVPCHYILLILLIPSREYTAYYTTQRCVHTCSNLFSGLLAIWTCVNKRVGWQEYACMMGAAKRKRHRIRYK